MAPGAPGVPDPVRRSAGRGSHAPHGRRRRRAYARAPYWPPAWAVYEEHACRGSVRAGRRPGAQARATTPEKPGPEGMPSRHPSAGAGHRRGRLCSPDVRLGRCPAAPRSRRRRGLAAPWQRPPAEAPATKRTPLGRPTLPKRSPATRRGSTRPRTDGTRVPAQSNDFGPPRKSRRFSRAICPLERFRWSAHAPMWAFSHASVSVHAAVAPPRCSSRRCR